MLASASAISDGDDAACAATSGSGSVERDGHRGTSLYRRCTTRACFDSFLAGARNSLSMSGPRSAWLEQRAAVEIAVVDRGDHVEAAGAEHGAVHGVAGAVLDREDLGAGGDVGVAGEGDLAGVDAIERLGDG